jgi:hypothetical protein
MIDRRDEMSRTTRRQNGTLSQWMSVGCAGAAILTVLMLCQIRGPVVDPLSRLRVGMTPNDCAKALGPEIFYRPWVDPESNIGPVLIGGPGVLLWFSRHEKLVRWKYVDISTLDPVKLAAETIPD